VLALLFAVLLACSIAKAKKVEVIDDDGVKVTDIQAIENNLTEFSFSASSWGIGSYVSIKRDGNKIIESASEGARVWWERKYFEKEMTLKEFHDYFNDVITKYPLKWGHCSLNTDIIRLSE
jgi:hypothetical protein